MADKYRSFEELKAGEREGVDFGVVCEFRKSPIAVFAPHGGHIEPTTSKIARATARDDLSLYLFEGLKPDPVHGDLHITSRLFDEPRALELAAQSQTLVALHGRLDRSDPVCVWIGGRDSGFASLVNEALHAAGFLAKIDGHEFPAIQPDNICNRGQTRGGVQLEIPMTLRDQLRDDEKSLSAFADALRSAIFMREKQIASR